MFLSIISIDIRYIIKLPEYFERRRRV